MRKVILVFLLFIATSSLYGETYFLVRHKIEMGDTFASILRKYVRRDAVINGHALMTQKTINLNPHIKNWYKLPVGEEVGLIISPDLLSLSNYNKYRSQILKKQKLSYFQKLASYPRGPSASVFYMASLGQFTQSSDTTATINFAQNSPVSIGGTFIYYPAWKKYFFSASAYYSELMDSTSNLSNGGVAVIEIPAEYGMNIYMDYRILSWNMTVYGGFDYERFSSFNLGAITERQKVLVDNNKVLYGTIGISKVFSLFSKFFFTKLSYSKSVSSTLQLAEDGVDPGVPYEGHKVMWYLNTKITDNFFVHGLVKYHTMTGPSNLTMLRYGAGFGYKFF